MADKPPAQFGKRRPSVPQRPVLPPKRSNHVALLVMGTLAVGGTAYALMPRACTPAPAETTPGVATPSECRPRSSSSGGGSGGGSWRYGYYSGGSSGSTAATSPDANSSGVRRGGFGGFAHSFASHFSFGS